MFPSTHFSIPHAPPPSLSSTVLHTISPLYIASRAYSLHTHLPSFFTPTCLTNALSRTFSSLLSPHPPCPSHHPSCLLLNHLPSPDHLPSHFLSYHTSFSLTHLSLLLFLLTSFSFTSMFFLNTLLSTSIFPRHCLTRVTLSVK